MKIQTIEIENFGIIEKFKYTFNSPITLLSGENGQGKSTVIKAILMNLFDVYSHTLDDYVNWNTGKNHFSVKSLFTHRGHSFESFMHYNGSTSRTLTIDGGQPYKNSEAVKKLAEYLDPKVDLTALVSRQDENNVVMVEPSKRREHARKVFDISYPREVETLQALESQIQIEIRKIEDALLIARDKKYELKPVPDTVLTEVQYSDRKKLFDMVQSDLYAAESKHKLFLEKADRLNVAHDKFVRAQSEVLGFKTTLTQPHFVALSEPQSFTKSPLYEALNNSKFILEEKIRGHESKVVDYTDQLSKIIPSRIPVFDRSTLDSLGQQLSVVGKTIFEKNKALQSAGTGVCSECGTRLPDADAIEAHKAKISAELSAAFEEKEQAENLEREEIKKLQAHELRVAGQVQVQLDRERFTKLIADEQLKLSQTQTELSKITNEVELKTAEFNQSIELLKEKKKSVEDQLLSARSRLEECRADQDNLQAELSAMTDDSEKLRKIKSEVELLDKEIKDYEAAIVEIERIKQENKQIQIDNQENDKLIRLLELQRQEAGQKLTDHTEARTYYQKDLPLFVVMQKIGKIQDEANKFLQETYAGRYQLSFEDKKDALYILYGPQRDARLASGYEKQLFSVAYMVGLSRLQNLGIMILDEPDSAASEKNSMLFYRVLMETREHLPQLILVSHRTPTKEMLRLDFKAEVLEFENGEVVA
jgi:DNA repair exonuclease SbcCD ATPase subunit